MSIDEVSLNRYNSKCTLRNYNKSTMMYSFDKYGATVFPYLRAHRIQFLAEAGWLSDNNLEVLKHVHGELDNPLFSTSLIH